MGSDILIGAGKLYPDSDVLCWGYKFPNINHPIRIYELKIELYQDLL